MTAKQLVVLLAALPLRAENWPQFRGPRVDGTSLETNLATTWSPTQNLLWKTALPGPGHSSPIVWENRIFLTAFRPDQSMARFFVGNRGQLVVLCLDRGTGRIRWEREVKAKEIEKVHTTNSPASPTPATDGKRVFVSFGSHGLAAFDFDGNLVWELPLGPYPSVWGSGSSPILSGDTLLVNNETDGTGTDFLLAVDKNTGRILWKAPRKIPQRGWATPMIWNGQIVINGSARIKAYAPKDGRELWAMEGMSTYVIPTPVAAHGMLYVASGGPGGNIIMAILPDGKIAWRYDKSAPYSSSLIVAGDHVYSVKNGGVMTCLNAKTGAVTWQQRLPARGEYYASPITAEGRIYTLSEDGEATVIAAKPFYELISVNKLGERTMASPAVSGGVIYIRSDQRLYAIAPNGRK